MNLKKEAKECAEELVVMATEKWKNKTFNKGDCMLDIDDITVVVAYFKWEHIHR